MGYSINLLIISILSLALISCAGQESEKSLAHEEQSDKVRIVIGEPNNEANRKDRFRGTFSDVQGVRLLVKEGSAVADNVSLTRTNNVWSGVLDNISIGKTYNFEAEAHEVSNPTFGNNSTLLFSGQLNSFPINSGDVQLPIRLSPYEPVANQNVLMPRITKIIYSPNTAPNEKQQIQVEVQAGVGDNLSYEFTNEYTGSGGSFSPSQGNYVVTSGFSSFVTDFTSPPSGSNYLSVTVGNQLNYKVSASFTIGSDNTTVVQPSILFNPVLLAFEAERLGNSDNLSFKATITDDGMLKDLSDNWSFNPAKTFHPQPSVTVGDNKSFETVMSGYNSSENGTLSLNILGTEGDNITFSWPIDFNAFPDAQRFSPYSSGLTQLATGAAHSCRYTNGSLDCWGDNTNLQINYNTSLDNSTSPFIVSTQPIQSVTAADNATCVLYDNQTVSCWGISSSSSTTLTGLDNSTPWISEQIDDVVTELCALSDNGSVLCVDWQNNTKEIDPGMTTARQVSVGSWGTCAVLDNASLECSNTITSPPSGLVKQVSVGRNHACAVLDSGNVSCWGDNSTGQLGNASSMPLNATYVSAGDAFNCALVEGEKLRCWGANGLGQLGAMNTSGSNATPGPVYGGFNNVIEVSAGQNHACALLKDNNTICWGDNGRGQLGDGSFNEKYYPVYTTN